MNGVPFDVSFFFSLKTKNKKASSIQILWTSTKKVRIARLGVSCDLLFFKKKSVPKFFFISSDFHELKNKKSAHRHGGGSAAILKNP